MRETLWGAQDFEGTPVGDRVFFPVSDAPGHVVRATSAADGLEYKLEGSGTTPVRCRYDRPACGGQFDVCGRCELEAPKPVEVAPDLTCLDVKPGAGALLGFVQLHRTVWPDDSTALAAPRDEAKALPTQRSELIGSLAQLEASGDRSVVGAIQGAGKMPPIRRGGVRVCRVTATGSLMLTGQLDAELTTDHAIVRLEDVSRSAR